MKKIRIFGHKNPDTDSVCASIALSFLKNKLGSNTEPRVLGDINKETKYALDYFKFDVPKYLNDVKTKIKDIKYHKDYYINKNTSIYDTYNFMNVYNLTGIPIVDNELNFVGYVSLKEIAKSMIKDTNNYIDTNFNDLIKILKSDKFIKIDNEIKGNIVSAILEDKTFIDNIKMDNNTILLVGDRKNIIEHAINSHVKLIIIIGENNLNIEQLINCKKNNINLICTKYSSFEVSKLLGLSNKIDTIKRNESCITLFLDDYMSDFINIANKTKHTNYPIIDKSNKCYGMLRLIDTNEFELHKVILVDHNEFKQSVDGLEEAEILEIIDHHNISGITTKMPINFRIMTVGSVNTIIYYMFKENNIEIPKNIAGLMLSGIISDTVLLNSPTTTIHDRIVLLELSKICNIDYKDYGIKLLKSGMDFKDKTIEEIIYNDFKIYNINDYKFGIGQILTVDYNDYKNIDDYVLKLNEISIHNNYKLTCLFITNIIDKSSLIIYNKDGENIIKDAYNLNDINEGVIVKDIISRKKQIVPFIMDVLEKR